MKKTLSSARQALISKVIADFDNKVSKANGFISQYENRPVFQKGLPWRGRLRRNLESEPESKPIGIVIAVEAITDTCAMIYADSTGDHIIDSYYIVEM